MQNNINQGTHAMDEFSLVEHQARRETATGIKGLVALNKDLAGHCESTRRAARAPMAALARRTYHSQKILRAELEG